MMTDDRVEARLREAGERWCAAQPPPADPDPARLTGNRLTRGMAPIAVAAGLVAVLAGAAIVASTLTREAAPPGGPANLVVHDGDTVEATGMVVVSPTAPARLCVNIADWATATANCAHGVELRGAVSPGVSTLRGTWNRGVLTVTERVGPSEPARPRSLSGQDLPRSPAPPEPPCPAPPGGWRPTPSTASVLDRGYLEQHGDRFGGGYVALRPLDPVVFIVEVYSGDLESARQELARDFSGNLCMVRGRYSLAEKGRIADALMRDPGNGVFAVDKWLPGRKAGVRLVVLDERVYAEISRIGLDGLELYPAVVPVR